MGNNGTNYLYMKGNKNPSKRDNVRKKISINRKGKRAGKEHQFYGKKRPEHSLRMTGKNNSDFKQSIERTCPTCKNIFYIKPCQKDKVYCSMKCYIRCNEHNNNWQGGKSKITYGKDWTEKLRESIRGRDKFICQICGRHQDFLDRKLHIHHIDKNKKNNNMNNLISLCNSCHNRLHRLTDNKEVF